MNDQMAQGVLISDVITAIDQVGPSGKFNYLGLDLAHYMVYKNIELNIY